LNWSYRRSNNRSDAGLGIIYCSSEERQMTVMELIVSIGLGGHILESGDALQDSMKMLFIKPQFGPQNIAALLAAIFDCNGIERPERCGGRDESTDTPKVGPPFKVCTVTFPADVVSYAKQRDFRLDGPDGSIYLYGKEVNRRRIEIAEFRARAREASEAAEQQAARSADEAGVAPEAIQYNQEKHKNDVYLDNTPEVQAALQAAYEEGRTATVPSQPVVGPNGEMILMAPYQTTLATLIDMAAGVTAPQRWNRSEYAALSKSQRQRWIRKLKGFRAHLRSRLPPPPHTAPEAEDEEEVQGAAAAPPAAAANGGHEVHSTPEVDMDTTESNAAEANDTNQPK
jgi:hypothetical protein